MSQQTTEGFGALVYQSVLPVSKQTVVMAGDLIRKHRRRVGSRWRKASPGRQALLALAVLRHDQRLEDLAGGNGVSASTLRRWVLELVSLLAARAPPAAVSWQPCKPRMDQDRVADGDPGRLHL